MLRRFIREYLSLSSGERKGILVLIVIMWVMILLRILLPVWIHPGKVDSAVWENELPRPFQKSPDPVRYFDFDPNTASLEKLLALGIPATTARTIINYREKGGSFNTNKDLLKIYGLKEKEYFLLEPYIRIKKQLTPDRISVPGVSGQTGQPELRSVTATAGDPDNRIGPARFELNNADTSVLKSVYGIGPVFASRIIKYRELLGGYYVIDQLREVYGLSEEQFTELSRCSYTDSFRVRTLNLNTVEIRELAQHPYLDAYQAAALLSYRNTMGNFHSLQEIPDNHLLSPEVFKKINPYLKNPE